MWINLFPYPNLCKAEKIKPTPRIIQKYFYSVYLTHQSDTNSRKTVYRSIVCNIFFIAFYIWLYLGFESIFSFFQFPILGVRNKIWDQAFFSSCIFVKNYMHRHQSFKWCNGLHSFSHNRWGDLGVQVKP